jgi:hypothetical protein
MLSQVVREGTPECYILDDDDQVLLNPYPIGVSQNNVLFVVSQALVAPTQLNQVFPIPERLIHIIKARTKYHLALNHIDDKSLAQLYNQEYENAVATVRSRERSRAVNKQNMYRSR